MLLLKDVLWSRYRAAWVNFILWAYPSGYSGEWLCMLTPDGGRRTFSGGLLNVTLALYKVRSGSPSASTVGPSESDTVGSFVYPVGVNFGDWWSLVATHRCPRGRT